MPNLPLAPLLFCTSPVPALHVFVVLLRAAVNHLHTVLPVDNLCNLAL